MYMYIYIYIYMYMYIYIDSVNGDLTFCLAEDANDNATFAISLVNIYMYIYIK